MQVTPPSLGDERGTTMVELLVGMAMGTIVLIGLSMTIIVVLHGTSRVDARVEATDNARTMVTRITEELHSACISPQIAPVRSGSTPTKLVFWRAAAGQANAVQPIPVKTTIAYDADGTLTQTDYAMTGGTSPEWQFEPETAGTTRTLLTDVGPPENSTAVFTYYRYEDGSPVKVAKAELGTAEAAETITVAIALRAAPKSSPVADRSAAATVQDSATMRLTPPPYDENASALPCQ